jgi:hypothetical protein
MTNRGPRRTIKSDQFTFRLRRPLADKLRETASKSCRSVSGEIEWRLEQSFARKDDDGRRK